MSSLLLLLLVAVITLTTHTQAKVGFKVNFETSKCKMQMNQPCNSNEHIKFYLYTPPNNGRILLDLKSKTVPESYDPAINIKVIIHGYSSLDFMDDVLAGYLKRGKDTLLIVDWEDLASKPCYVSAKMNTRQVGRCTGEALSMLKPIGEIHIVGFSLGAHVAGHVSSFLNNHGILIDRITGLDPALPLYATPVDEFKLDKSDAKFVDVIHSNPGMFGKAEPSGHVDFYINGVSIQPGCYNVSNPPRCSHRRAAEVFGESITSAKGFWGAKCTNFFSYLTGLCRKISSSSKRVLMGEYANSSSRGIYYVRTNKSPPYAQGLS